MTPLEKLVDLKMKYGEYKATDGIEEFSIAKPKNKFVTFKSSMRDAEQPMHDETGRIIPHVNPKRHLIKPRPDKKEPTYLPKEQ